MNEALKEEGLVAAEAAALPDTAEEARAVPAGGLARWSVLRRKLRAGPMHLLRLASGLLPRSARAVMYRKLVRCEEKPSDKLVLKLAETREELEACFRLLHDAYVQAGFMAPHPSGMRVTVYHALPTTTTLLARYGDRVVGTISLVRENALGFPLQRIFDIADVRERGGNIAEVSALAVDRRFHATGGTVLFPLMKFMYEYATNFFDTRHLVIAVNPRHIGLYESLLMFRRLPQNPVDHYDFVNGAPAVGAHLDLAEAPALLQRHYRDKRPSRNLHHYFTALSVPNMRFPDKRFFTTNDPVMTPALMEHFFNRVTTVFSELGDREKALLHAIYDLPDYQACLPPISPDVDPAALRRRQHQRFSVRCPASVTTGPGEPQRRYTAKVVECSRSSLRARIAEPLPVGATGTMSVDLGALDHSTLRVEVIRQGTSDPGTFVCRIIEHDLPWLKFVNVLRRAQTHGDLEEATRFMVS